MSLLLSRLIEAFSINLHDIVYMSVTNLREIYFIKGHQFTLANVHSRSERFVSL